MKPKPETACAAELAPAAELAARHALYFAALAADREYSEALAAAKLERYSAAANWPPAVRRAYDRKVAADRALFAR